MRLSDLNSLSLQEAAVAYAHMGFRVFPCAVGGKEPRVRWSEVATSNPASVELLWDLYPDSNIGLAMGDGDLAVDLDLKHGQNGPLSWDMIGAPGRVWPIQLTPSGGQHVLIRGVDGSKLRNVTRRGDFGGIDLRTDGGYICVAPSVLPEGPYRWAVGGDARAPLPPGVKGHLEAWSERAARREGLADPTEGPSELTPAQCTEIAQSLGGYYTAFLVNGVSWSGDTSKDAYGCTRQLLKRGVSLGDLREIAGHTYLGFFGSAPPHGSPAPLDWYMRYTAKSAYQDHQAEIQAMFGVLEVTKERPPSGEGGPKYTINRREKPGDEPDGRSIWDELGVVNPTTTPQEPPPDPTLAPEDLYRLFQARAQALPSGDFLAAEEWAKKALTSGLPGHYLPGLLLVVKGATGFGLGVLNQMLASLRKSVQTPVPRVEPSEVFVRSQDRFFDRRAASWVSKGAMASSLARDHGGDPNAALDFYLHGVGAVCPIVDEVGYDPGEATGVTVDKRGVRVFNRYRPSDRLALQGDVSPWLGVLDALAPSGGDDVRNRLLDELAWVVQNPGEKLNHGFVLGGAKGIGKDSFLAPVIEAVGAHNVQTVNGDALASSFQSYLANTKMVVFNEIHMGSLGDRGRISERLKPLLAAPPDRLQVDEKNLRPYSIPNVIQCVLQTNHRDGLHIETGERRYFAVWCDAVIRPEDRGVWEQHFTAYWRWLELEQGHEKVFGWLLARDVSHINPKAWPLITDWLIEMMTQAVDPLTSWVHQQIRRREGVFGAVDFTGDALWSYAQMAMPDWLRSRPLSESMLWRAVITAPGNPFEQAHMGPHGPVFRIKFSIPPPGGLSAVQ